MTKTIQPIEQNADQRDKGLVPSVNAACRILEALSRPQRDGATLSELSRELELSKSSVHGLLRTLQAWGYVQRAASSRRFRLGATLVSMGRAAATQLRAAALLGERLPVLAGEHHLTFAVAQVTDYGDAQVIDRAYPLDDIHVGLALGGRYGAFDGAIGKCLLAAMPPEHAREVVLAGEIPQHTERTIIDPRSLLAEVDRVRETGWASSVGELKENRAVAAPLFSVDGGIELVLFAVGFPGQMPDGGIAAIGSLLRETARAVEAAPGAAAAELEAAQKDSMELEERA